MPRKKFASSGLGAASLILMVPTAIAFTPADALGVEQSQVSTIEVVSAFPVAVPDPVVQTVTTLDLQEAMPTSEAESMVLSNFGPMSFTQQGTTLRAESATIPTIELISAPPMSPPEVTDPEVRDGEDGSAYANIYCNKHYQFSDSNGSYDIDRECGGTVGRWGFRLSSSLKSICDDPVSERGMKWTKDGSTMPMNAPHVEECWYIFHGTYNPIARGSRVTYADHFSFHHHLGPGGLATVDITGNLRFRGAGT